MLNTFRDYTHRFVNNYINNSVLATAKNLVV